MKKTILLAVLFLFTLVSVKSPAHCETTGTIVFPLQSEELHFQIDFLFFKGLAEGVLKFEPTNQQGVFRVELVGRTLGIASWLSGERTQIYTSTMQRMPDGSFTTIEHTAKVMKKKWGKWRRYRKVCEFDCERGLIQVEKIKDGVVTSTETHEIPAGETPVDMLTAFYNLRQGVYGELGRGRKIMIPTYSSKGFHQIQVQVLTEEEQGKKTFFPGYGLLVKAVIDPDIFETGSGNLYVWFDEKGIPARGIIEDIIGLGDIKGHLKEEPQ